MPHNADKKSPNEKPSTGKPHRFITRDGRINVQRQGIRYRHPRDWYHWLMALDWRQMVLVLIGLYLLSNIVFAGLYMLDPSGIANARKGSFSDAFFFSVQTLATIGYGHMAPISLYTNVIVTIEYVVGMTILAMFTGLLFSRFSRPTARVMFSHYAVVSPYDGQPTLMFRAANKRGNQILQAEVRVTLTRNEKTVEGEWARRVYDLKLIRNFNPLFNLTWTIHHQINSDSPLYGMTTESLRDSESELTVLLSGIDDVFGQPVYGRFSFGFDEILFNHRFVDMFGRDEHNRPVMDYGNFDKVEPLQTKA